MRRLTMEPRPDRGAKLESQGLSFHSWDNYWNEDACYEFSLEQVNVIEKATNELHAMCLETVDFICRNEAILDFMAIPRTYWGSIVDSWNRKDFSVYGRFDLAYDGINPPKMMEYNADTPTSLLESSVAQWYWMKDVCPEYDQFNSIHEKLVEQWKKLPDRECYFASLNDNEEDWVCVHYLMETARQAGLAVEHIFVEGIGVKDGQFVDGDEWDIKTIFKLYPWEWMMNEPFGASTFTSKTQFIEPLWKALLSNKHMLSTMWHLFPNHPNLLKTTTSEAGHNLCYAKKPFFSREGANIELYRGGEKIASDDGPYGAEGYIYQELVELPQFTSPDGKVFPIIGSWVVGDAACGMCVREDRLRITTNMSNFVPHRIRI